MADLGSLEANAMHAMTEVGVSFQKILVKVCTAIYATSETFKSVQTELTQKRRPFGVLEIS
jgi:hypothetical protein